MKKLVIAIAALFPVIAFSQSATFSLKGDIKAADAPAKAFLMYRYGETDVTDSVTIKHGLFEFSGQITDPIRALMVIDHKGIGLANLKKQRKADLLMLYLEAGSLNITGPDSLSKAKITGSKINDDSRIYQELLATVNKKRVELEKEFFTLSAEQKRSAETKKSFQQRAALIDHELKELRKKFITENPNSYISLEALIAYGGYAPDVDEIEPLFSGLPSAVKQTAMGKSYGATLEKLKATRIGSIAPEFTQNDTAGKPVKLSDFRGKYVLVDFWASWCGPCRQENPNVAANYARYQDKNFTVLGVSLDRPGDKPKWLKAIEDDKLNWTNVSDLNHFKNAAAVQYNVTAIPQNYLIDPDGKIIAKNLRGEALGQKLEELLK